MKIKMSLMLAVTLAACGICRADGPDAASSKQQPAATGGMKAVAASGDEVAAVIEFNSDTTLPQAVQTLARSAGINIQFDPALLNATKPDGQPLPPPVVNAVRWENITPKQALTALLENYNWRLVQDVNTGISRVTRKDTNSEPMVTTVVQLNFANPTNIAYAVTNTMSRGSRIIPDMRTSQVIVMTQEKELDGVMAMIKKLDRGTRQVLIEAKIVETLRNPSTIKGIDWTKTLQNQEFLFGNGTTAGTIGSTSPTGNPSDPGTTTLQTLVGLGGITANTAHGFSPATAFLNAQGVDAVLSFLNTDADTKSLALPRTVALDGVPTELAMVRNIPVFEQQTSAGGTGQNNLIAAQANYEKKVGNTIINEVGIKLNVTPHIVGMTNVSMVLAPEVSLMEAAPEVQTLDGNTYSAPVFSRRKVTTDAMVPSGYTLVVGGLDNDNTERISTKVPILGDIPGLGFFFHSDSKTRTKQNLLIFVTPTIVADSDYQCTPTDFLKTKFKGMPEQDETAWDSAHPYDWTKPSHPDEPCVTPKNN